ncbi:preprotein translocase subunit SecE [Candidatus Daviesbacteria bacterium]|nr:preprotein translocase subunit SecE [Candidatus Daviesbacteria bacterium]
MSKVIDFLRDVKVELSKVVWPTPQQTFKLTMIVIIVTVSVGFFVGAVDLILTKLVSIIIK